MALNCVIHGHISRHCDSHVIIREIILNYKRKDYRENLESTKGGTKSIITDNFLDHFICVRHIDIKSCLFSRGPSQLQSTLSS